MSNLGNPPHTARSRVLPIAEFGLAGLIFVACAIIITFPLIRDLSNAVLEAGDTLQVSWLLAWNTQHLLSGPKTLFSPAVMHPEPYALTHIEHMLGLIVPFAPMYWLSGNPILSYSTCLLFGYSMSGFATFILLYSLLPKTRVSWWAALLAGLLFECAPWRVIRPCHLEQVSASWLPLSLLCLVRYLERKKWPWLMGFAAFTVIQTLTSYYYVVTWGLVAMGGVAFMAVSRKTNARTVVIACVVVALVSIAAHLPLALIYVGNSVRQPMSIEEQYWFSLQTRQDFLGSRQSVWLRKLIFGRGAIPTPNCERALDAGPLAYVLAGIGVISLARGSPTYRRAVLACLGVIISSAILSLGPFVVVKGLRIPAPFMLLRLLPGFGSFRAPGRFWQAGLFAIAVLGGIATWGVTLLLGRRTGVALVGVLLCLIPPTMTLTAPRPTTRIEPPSPVFQWIDDSLPVDAVLLQVPLDIRADGWSWIGEAAKMYASLYHHRRLVNSYMAWIPPAQRARQQVLSAFPKAEAVQCAMDLGVTHVLVNRADLTPDMSSRLTSCAESGLCELREAFRDDQHIVFAVVTTPETVPRSATVRFLSGWHGLELLGSSWWNLSVGEGVLEIASTRDQVVGFAARVSIVSAPDNLRIYDGDTLLWQGQFPQPGHHSIGPIHIPLEAGTTNIRIVNSNPSARVGLDPRLIGFGIGDVSLNGENVRVCELR